LSGQIGYVETIALQDVAVLERIALQFRSGLDLLVNLQVHVAVDLAQAADALALNLRIDGSDDLEQLSRSLQFKMHGRPLRERDALERFQRHLVVQDEPLPAARQQPTDVDFVH
jgi:hypothetical protein